MSNKRGAGALFAIGLFNGYWPTYGKFFGAQPDFSVGEGRIVAAILLVGAAIVWFMPQPKA